MDGIDTELITTILLVVLTVVALGSVASTISDVSGAESQSTIDFEPRNQPGDDIADNRSPVNGSGEDISNRSSQGISLAVCIEALQSPPAILGIVAAVGLLLFGVYRRYNAAASLLLATGVVPVAWGGFFFLTNCGYSTGGGGGLFGDSTSVLQNDVAASPVSVPPVVIVGIFALLMIVGVAAVLSATSDDETVEPAEEEIEEPDAADFAAAARRAADRIEEGNVPVDNAVYRAWLEMTGLLDIEKPDTTTPRDFAGMVIDAGLREDDVTELTQLFNEVRYGDKSAANREDRALEILRNIEDTYEADLEAAADEDGDDAAADGPDDDDARSGSRGTEQ